MAISFNEKTNIFKLDAKDSTYCIKILKGGFLAHLYYGRFVSSDDLEYVLRYKDRSFSPQPVEFGEDRTFSLDVQPLEYSGSGIGDYRASAISVQMVDGTTSTDLRYKSHTIFKGKKVLKGLPATYVEEEFQATTLEITLEDRVSGLEVVLSYTTFESYNVITRSVQVINKGTEELVIKRIMSSCVDFDNKDFELIDLQGSWANERQIQRHSLRFGKQALDSKRGTSSPQHNPFFALARPTTDEDKGEIYGFSLVYSGNFLAEIEVDQFHTLRTVMGINPEDFSWVLEQGESFVAPEVVMVYSYEGMGGMSRTFNKLYRKQLCRGHWKDKERPILINNWEATYFDFDEEKIFNIAEGAKNLGIEMLVLDDGWFGKRDADISSLGDWFVDEKKLKGGLGKLVERINAIDMKFGIWVEPEMISPDSDLYRKHPNWCLHVKGRNRTLGRSQLVLDMSRRDVIDYLDEVLTKLLNSANIEYVKWDMNRHLTEVGSELLESKRQQEVWHRYVLGLYELLDRLISKFPKVLFEGCSGGGGRFDPGMLYYCPQSWLSDDTDGIERIGIQLGSSLVYPACSMAAHVSACPNHQVNRITPIETRGLVALSGSFGYELDITKITEGEKEAVKKQIEMFHKVHHLVRTGDLYRHITPFEDHEKASWSFVSEDKKEVLVKYVQMKSEVRAPFHKVYLRGLEPNATYVDQETGKAYKGDTLMYVGLNIPHLYGDYLGYHCHLVQK